MSATIRSLLFLGLVLGADAFGAVVAEDLPAQAQALRDAGLDADEVRSALVASKAAGLKAADAAALLASSVEPVQEHGPVASFGSFVKQQLDAGLRGADLSGAIRTEHENRGLGNANPKPTPAPVAPTNPTPEPAEPTRPAPVRPVPTRPKPAPVRPVPAPTPKSKFRPKGQK